MPAFLPRWPLSGFARANPRIFDVQMSGLGLAMSRSVLAREDPTKRRWREREEWNDVFSDGGLVDRNAN